MMKKYDEMALARKENSFQFLTSTTLEEYMDSGYVGLLNAFLYDDEVCFFISNKYIINFLSYTKEFQRFSCLIKELNLILKNSDFCEKITTEEFLKKLNDFFSKESYLENLLRKIKKQFNIIYNKLINLSDEIDEFNEYYLNGKNIKYNDPTTYVCEIEKEEMKNKALLKEKILNNKWRMGYNDYNLYFLKDQNLTDEFSRFLHNYYHSIFHFGYEIGIKENGELFFELPIFNQPKIITTDPEYSFMDITNSLLNNGFENYSIIFGGSSKLFKKQISDSIWIYFRITQDYKEINLYSHIYFNCSVSGLYRE